MVRIVVTFYRCSKHGRLVGKIPGFLGLMERLPLIQRKYQKQILETIRRAFIRYSRKAVWGVMGQTEPRGA
tara:strand:- start:557 stop:769 length:213 start_codon:yes stop_codon:yes gene_type:complete